MKIMSSNVAPIGNNAFKTSVVMLYGIFATTLALGSSAVRLANASAKPSHFKKSPSTNSNVSAYSSHNPSRSFPAKFLSFSTANTRAPRANISFVRFPVPGPISSTRSPARRRAASTASVTTVASTRKCCPNHRLAS